MIYFQDSSNHLYSCDLSNNQYAYLNQSTLNPPMAVKDRIFFRGTDGNLWACNLDGSGGQMLGSGIPILSSPYVTDNYVFFQGYNNMLTRCNLDGSDVVGLGHNTYDTPALASISLMVIFHGDNNMLCKIDQNGASYAQIRDYTTNTYPTTTVYLGLDFIVFRGVDSNRTTWRCDIDGGNTLQLGDANSTPTAPGNDMVYYQGKDGFLYSNGMSGINGIPYKQQIDGTPAFDSDTQYLAYKGVDGGLYKIPVGGGNPQTAGSARLANPPVEGINLVVSTVNIKLDYNVIALFYAPPGTDESEFQSNSSSVEYGNSSVMGTSNSVSNSFKTSTSLTASVGFDVDDNKAMEGMNFSTSQSVSNSQSINITKSTAQSFYANGSTNKNGIDHDEDLFFIWLNPGVNVGYNKAGNPVVWNVFVNGSDMHYVVAAVKYLKDPDLMQMENPDLYKNLVTKAGLTTDDFNTILGLNPFTKADVDIDKELSSGRYIKLIPMPYTLPTDKGNAPQQIGFFHLDSATFIEQSNTVEDNYSVGYSIEAGVNDEGFKESLSSSTTFEWGVSNTHATSTQNEEQATLTLIGPTSDYQGPQTLYVYWDTLYSSFMFQLGD